MISNIIDAWQRLAVKRKIMLFSAVVFLIIVISVGFDIYVVKISLGDFNGILSDNNACADLINSFEKEAEAFDAYVTSRTPERKEGVLIAIKNAENTVDALPFIYSDIGEDRYFQTWNIRNCHEQYVKEMKYYLTLKDNDVERFAKKNEITRIYGYLATYADRLMTFTLADGNRIYEEKLPAIWSVPITIALVGLLLVLGTVELSALMNRSIIEPVTKLGDASRRISLNDFYIDDIKVDNKDEFGDLVEAFNKMKFATGEYIRALEGRRETMELLHAEELERVQAEQALESMKLELLRSQVNPHFLFNTLNVISGMATLEDAPTTEKMTKALSALFRYNLKTSDDRIELAQELKVVTDYLYIQQMRFGDRIKYDIDCRVDKETTIVPTHTFQPLVENCIMHGISSKVDGGRIVIRIQKAADKLVIIVADNGIGMSRESLLELRSQLGDENKGRIGIGLGNVWKRVHALYPGSVVHIYSKKDYGTAVRIEIPEEETDV